MEIAIGEASGVATDVTNAIIGVVFQQLKDVRNMGDNLQLLNTELARMDESLRHIQTQFEHQQRQLPEMVEGSLGRMKDALEEVKALIDRANGQRGRCRGCCLFFSPKIPADIREWKTRFNELFRQLDSDLSRAAHTAEIVGSAQPQAEVLLQPLPDSGFVGSGIEAAQQQLLSWLNEPHPQARVIGVWGMAGVGKTSLLQLIYNNCKKKVSTSFDLVIWHTISQKYKIDSLQDAIAESLELKFEPSSSIDMRKMKLYDSLKDKRFLLVLDDLWSPINLNEVGVNFGRDKNSRVLISSRYRDVVEIMAEKEYCMMIRPLSEDEGWELFQKTAFKSGAAQDKNLEVIARQVASECKGLPLAINTVAAAIARKKTAEEWSRALVLMKNADPSFPSTHKTIEAELYQKLRWSYDDLPNHGLKMCFLYCAAFPEDAEIYVETLVEMWTAERLFLRKGKTYFMDVGREYIQALVDRCLIEYVDADKREIKVHDVLRDMAIYVGQGEENCLFQAGQHLQHFPSEEETRDCKRISVLDNEISYLPPDLKCPTLVSLVLAKNRRLKEIPEGFLVNCMSLKVLDLSDTSVKTLPTAVGQLGQLEFLNLSRCDQLEDLPDSICDLSHLQFLNLEDCGSLDFLPDKIGELKILKHLTVSGSYSVRVIPHQISQLTSLNKLVLRHVSTPMCLEDLTNLSNLIELDVTVKPEIKGGSMSTWSKMRKIRLRFEWGEDENRDENKDEKRDDAALDILPENMQSMEELLSLELEDYEGVSLPTCICQFQNLKNLDLRSCMNLEELPRGGFPELQRLNLHYLHSLESVVVNAKTMSQLQTLNISVCSVLKTLKMEELPNLRELDIRDCAELKELFMESGGCFPQLGGLSLSSLDSLESIVCTAKTMPQLRSLSISDCGGLKTLRMEELPNLRKLHIRDCAELKELFMESGGCFPQLQVLKLRFLDSLESILCNAKTMPQMHFLKIRKCRGLKTLRMEGLPNLRVLTVSGCAELKELFMESGGCFPQLEVLELCSLDRLESIVCNAKTMPQMRFLKIRKCRGLKTLRMEELPNLRVLYIQYCAELKELFMESGGGFPQLESLELSSLHSLESIVCNAKTMPQLDSLRISDCGGLKTLRMEELPNLRILDIQDCAELKELFMESGGGFPELETLDLSFLHSLESIVCNAKTMPQLHFLQIRKCSGLKTLRMEELPNLWELDIQDCAELKELFMESGGCFPQLEELSLSSLHSLESIVCNAKTMPQLRSLSISDCRGLKTLRMEELPNLRKLHIQDCAELKELFMESGGGFPQLEELCLSSLHSLESIVCNAKTMPQLRSLSISDCGGLKTLRMEELPNLRELDIQDCAELKELFMESGGCFPQLEVLELCSLDSLESIVCNAKTMPQLHSLRISDCGGLKTLRMEELPNLRKLHIQDCAELKELFMESGGGFPQLEELCLYSLDSLESIVCNAKTMPQLHSLRISDCGGLKTLRMEELPNLRKLDIQDCAELKELFMESGGCFPQLEELTLGFLCSLESIVCNAKTMPQLHFLKIIKCSGLKTLRMEELPNLRKLHIRDCAELKELFMESGGCFPQLEVLELCSLHRLESIVCNAKTMPQLHSLRISDCGGLKTLRMEVLPKLRKLDIQDCAELKELFMESGGCFPQLEVLELCSLDSLESIVCNAKTMPQLHSLRISDCGGLKTLRMEELPNLRKLDIQDCAELKELFMESGGCFPQLEELTLGFLHSLESIVCNAKTMPQLHSLGIEDCGRLKTLRMEEFPDLQYIVIYKCPELEVEIESLPMLEELHLEGLEKAESIARPSSVWNSDTMPNLEVVQITGCPLLRRMPREMEKLPKLKKIVGNIDWWDGISWENDNVKSELSHLFKEFEDEEESDEDIEIEEESEVEESDEESEFEVAESEFE